MISIFINSMTSGGAEKVVLTLLEQFRQREQDMELVLIEKEQFYEIPQDTKSHYLTQFESLEHGLLKFPSMIWCALRLKKRVNQQGVSVVQSHLFRASFINVFAKLFGAKHLTQIIVHSRINFDHQPRLAQGFSKWVYRQVFKRADSIVSICQVMKNELDHYVGLEGHPNHRVIYNPHDLMNIKYLAKEDTNAFVFSGQKKYLIAIGRLVKLKRYVDIIKALELVRQNRQNVELIFIGDGEEKEHLQETAKARKIERFVHFLGYQSNPYSYLAKADIMVLSSRTEGLPNIIIESMACGIPVIASDCISGPRELLNPGSDLCFNLKAGVEKGAYGLLYPVGEVNDLAKAITILLQNDNIYNKYRKKGLKRANEFDAVKISEQYMNSFNS